MNLRLLTFFALALIPLISCSKQEDKFTRAEYESLLTAYCSSDHGTFTEPTARPNIYRADGTADHNLPPELTDIPVGTYGNKEIVEILDPKTGKFKKIIRDRSKYAKSGSQKTDDRRQKTPNTEYRTPNTDLGPRTSDLGPRTSDLDPSNPSTNTSSSSTDPSSVLRPPSSDSALDPELQESLLEMSAQSNDLIITREKVNSDYIDAIATNNGAVWLMGLKPPQNELGFDYGDRLFEIPGVGYYLLPKGVAPDDADFTKEKISVLEEAFSLKPNSPELAHELALSYAKDGGNLDKALATINSVAEKNPGNIDLAYEKAEVLRVASENQNYADQKDDLINRALEKYEIAARTSKNPDAIAESAINAHKILAERGETQQGIKLLEDAYYDTKQKMNNDNYLKIIVNLGKHYYDEGDYNTALNWYDNSKVDYWAFEQSKGDIYQKLGDLNNAAQSYKRSVRFNPAQFGPNIKLISTYAKNGQLYEAEQALKKYKNQLAKKSKKRRKAIENSTQYKKAIELLRKN